MAKQNKKKYKIRPAKAMDAFILVQFYKKFLEEIADKFPPVKDDDCIAWILSVINQGGVWVAISDRKIVGSIGCSVDTFPWNRSHVHVFDEWYYVLPNFRKGYDISKELINFAKKRADDAGLPFIFSVNSGKDKRIDRFVEMQGFNYMGGISVSWPPEVGNNG